MSEPRNEKNNKKQRKNQVTPEVPNSEISSIEASSGLDFPNLDLPEIDLKGLDIDLNLPGLDFEFNSPVFSEFEEFLSKPITGLFEFRDSGREKPKRVGK